MDQLEQARQLFLDALALQEKGDLEQAERLYRQALALAPERPSVMNNLAAVCIELEKYPEARLLCERLLELNPRDETALLNLGNCRIKSGTAEDALLTYDLALKIKPDYAEAHNSRGAALLELQRREEALASFDRALTVKPGYLEALSNRGNVLLELGRLAEALASFDRALAIKPDYADALNNRGDALQAMGRCEELIENYKALLRARPDHDYALGHMLRAQLQCCDWTRHEDYAGQLSQAVRAGKRAHTPFDFLVISESANDQLQCARTYVADQYPAAEQPLWRGERYRHDRIRVAYLSGDLRRHAVAYLIAGLIEAHDRSRFEITAISLGPDDDDEMTRRLRAAFDRFVDVRDMSDQEVALLLRELEIDIAVDLQGFTKGCRPGILSRRAAPVQVNYLGFPGTMGAPYMDYIIADRTVIPSEHHSCYAENVVYLPECYQVNDSKRRIATHTPSRAEAGLPEKGFVYCCFNNNHKINPRVFGIWMRLLNEVGGSVLWLLEDNQAAAGNLRRQAERSGVAPGRVIFAPRMRMEEHLARHRLADLFLDTLPYNAHVTGSDALWTGLPVLTHMGHAFAGRVAASLLKAVGLPELITRSWEEYEQLALALAREPARLADIRARLTRSRATHPLFDTDRYRRRIESAYVTMWERVQRGAPAVSFSVPGGS